MTTMTSVMNMTTIKTYSELITLPTFEERYRYLKLSGRVGEDTFGWDRYLNQALYRSKEWRDLRNAIIVRDEGCDLGCIQYPIAGKILIHHINPISKSDILLKYPIIVMCLVLSMEMVGDLNLYPNCFLFLSGICLTILKSVAP